MERERELSKQITKEQWLALKQDPIKLALDMFQGQLVETSDYEALVEEMSRPLPIFRKEKEQEVIKDEMAESPTAMQLSLVDKKQDIQRINIKRKRK